jgi:hypothetical protein
MVPTIVHQLLLDSSSIDTGCHIIPTVLDWERDELIEIIDHIIDVADGHDLVNPIPYFSTEECAIRKNPNYTPVLNDVRHVAPDAGPTRKVRTYLDSSTEYALIEFFKDTLDRNRYESKVYGVPRTMVPYQLLRANYDKLNHIGLHNIDVFKGKTSLDETSLTSFSNDLKFGFLSYIAAENPGSRILFINGGCSSILYTFLSKYPDFEAYNLMRTNVSNNTRTRVLQKMRRHWPDSNHEDYFLEEVDYIPRPTDVVVDYYPDYLSTDLYGDARMVYVHAMELDKSFNKTPVTGPLPNFSSASSFLMNKFADSDLPYGTAYVLYYDGRTIRRCVRVVHATFSDVDGVLDILNAYSMATRSRLDEIPVELLKYDGCRSQSEAEKFLIYRIVPGDVIPEYDVAVNFDGALESNAMIMDYVYGVCTQPRIVDALEMSVIFPDQGPFPDSHKYCVATFKDVYYLVDLVLPFPYSDRQRMMSDMGVLVLPVSCVPLCSYNYFL